MSITPIGFGAWAIGGPGWETAWGPQDDAESIAAIRHGVESGINWIDTAPIYGHGHSEEVVAAALADIPAADRPYVFTKCGLIWDAADPMAPPRLTLERLRWQLEWTLRRLRIEVVDLLQVHWPPREGPSLDEGWQAMRDLVTDGLVRAVGVSNYSVDQLTAAEKVGHVDSLQPPLSLLRRDVAAAEVPWCAEHGTGVVVYSPMESGLLTGTFSDQRAATLDPGDWRSRSAEFSGDRLVRNLALVDRLRPIAYRHDSSVAAIAVAWTLAWPGVTAAIVGARRPGQIDGWLSAANLRLDDADLAEIEAALGETGVGSGPLRP
ncbi:MAG TPA: aldo/keto reductase [Actinomycetes bacterium]|nr:aldo/keto reductase [Actinomycetes bacterium]